MLKIIEEWDWKMREDRKSNVTKLREEYFILAGKKPYLWWAEVVLEQKVAELKESGRVSDDTLAVKKSEWKNQ